EALGKKKEAIADYREALKINGEDRLNKTRLDRVDPTQRDADECAKARGDDAIATCSRLLTRDPKNASAYVNRGKAYKDHGYKNNDEYERAIANYDQAMRRDPNEAEADRERGSSYEMKRDSDRTIADSGEAVRHNPKDARAYKSRGNVYRSKGDFDRAIADYD